MTIIGINLTSNSGRRSSARRATRCHSRRRGHRLGGKAFPSYVAIGADGTVLVGEPARRQMRANPEGTVTAFKRLMGTRQKIRLREREFTAEQLSAFPLQKSNTMRKRFPESRSRTR